VTAPTPEQQVAFLGNVQRLLAEGSFVATYKHALLLALAELSVELGDDSGAPLVVPVAAIAEKIVIYYWRQALPFPSSTGGLGILKQNTGKQAAIVRLIADEHKSSGGSLVVAKAKRSEWAKLIAEVSRTVKKMPLWKLQRVGSEVLDFLYPNIESGDAVELRPGAAFCFRRFHGFVEDLVRGAWVRCVRGIGENQPILGEVANLDEFLFGSGRGDLSAFRTILIEIQSGQCFYCKGRIDKTPAVDHFVPWSRYPVDLGHNFVLSHATCNARKGDRLAAFEHLAHWCERNERHAQMLDQVFLDATVVANRTTSNRIASWAYGQVEATSGLVWVKDEQLVPLDAGWQSLLDAAA
jgi:hypothetical protein